MALRLSPGGRRGTGRRLGAGIGAGLSNVGDFMMRQASAQQSQQRQFVQSFLKDATDKVAAGTWEPEQAVAAMKSQAGTDVPSSYFESLRPSTTIGLSKAMDDITKAGSPQEVPTPEALALSPAVTRRKPVMGPTGMGEFPMTRTPQAGTDGNLPSTSTQPFSPELAQLLAGVNSKMKMFAPTKVSHVDAEGTKVDEFVSSDPRSLTGRSFQAEPTPQQAGQRAAAQDIAQEQGRAAGGYYEMQGQGDLKKWLANEGDAARIQTQLDAEMSKDRAKIPIDVERQRAMAPGDINKSVATATATKRAGMAIDQEYGVGDFKQTGDERSAYAYANELANAHNAMLLLEPKLMQRAPLVQSALNAATISTPSLISDPLTRQYATAMNTAINAIARRQSGAAISEDEWKRYGQRLAFVPGDDARTLQGKQEQRRMEMGGLKVAAGSQLGKTFVTMDELRRLATAEGKSIDVVAREATASGYKVVY